MNIKGKVAIVTGASQGIGRATAAALARRGAKVALAARDREALLDLARELPESLAVPADLRRPDDIENLARETVSRFGRIDILVNNAAQGLQGRIEAVDLEKYRSIIELNVLAPLRLMQAVIPEMRRQGGGVIVNVSSNVSKNHFPDIGAYASTKYALNGLSLTAREELAPNRISVCLMHPKMTSSNFFKNYLSSEGAPGRVPPPGIPMDAPEAVAEKICGLIESEEAEASM